MSICRNENIVSKYQRDPLNNVNIDNYTFNDIINYNGCEIEFIGSIHDSKFSKRFINKKMENKDFEEVGVEISDFLLNYYLGKISLENYLKKIKKESESFSTKYFIEKVRESNLSRDSKENIFNINTRNIEETDMIYTLQKAIDQDKPYTCIDQERYLREKIIIDSKNFLVKLFLGNLIKHGLIKLSIEKNILPFKEKKRQKIFSNLLCDDKKFVFNNISLSHKNKIHKSRDKEMIKNIKEMSKTKNNILIVIGLGHYKNIVENNFKT